MVRRAVSLACKHSFFCHRSKTDVSIRSYTEIQQKITPFLKAAGFNPKTDLTFIPVSAQMGQNMKDPIGKKIAPWYE